MMRCEGMGWGMMIRVLETLTKVLFEFRMLCDYSLLRTCFLKKIKIGLDDLQATYLHTR